VLGAITTEITTRLKKRKEYDNKTEQKGTHYRKETKRGKREKNGYYESVANNHGDNGNILCHHGSPASLNN